MKLVCALLALVTQVAAQTTYLDAPEPVFTTTISPPGIGNECTFGGSTLICTGADGTVSALDPTAATPALWSYVADVSGQPSSMSGVSISGSTVIYGVTVGGNSCRVDGIDIASGAKLWSSAELFGACAGTPVVSADGGYTFVSHNPADGSSGGFTVLKGADTFFEFTDDQPLSPPGIYHSPAFGNYAGGEGNSNDIVVFGNTLIPNEGGVSAGSESFAFQFPIGFTDASDATNLGVTSLLMETNWKSVSPPLLSQGGTKMHWGVSRGDLLAWTDREFSRDVGGFRTSLGRGSPSYQPINADLVIDMSEMTLYTGSAGTGLFALVAEDLTELWTVPTTTPVYAKAVLSPDETVVYMIEQNGLVQSINTGDGSMKWQSDATFGSVWASFAQSASGDMIYFADSSGFLNGWKVADVVTTPTDPVPTDPLPMPTEPPLVTGAPATASPGTNAPVDATGAPATATPGTAAPVGGDTMPPATASPGTDAPVGGDTMPPATASPGTDAPVGGDTMPPATASPGSDAPVGGDTMPPVSAAPVGPTDVPVTGSPVTSAPVGPSDAPATASPVTPAPVAPPTAAPVPSPTPAPVETTDPPSSASTTSMLALAVVAVVGFFM